jgi:hypothetical protein
MRLARDDDAGISHSGISHIFALLRQSPVCLNTISERAVIPARAGIHASYRPWIPTFAGMTIRFE